MCAPYCAIGQTECDGIGSEPEAGNKGDKEAEMLFALHGGAQEAIGAVDEDAGNEGNGNNDVGVSHGGDWQCADGEGERVEAGEEPPAAYGIHREDGEEAALENVGDDGEN